MANSAILAVKVLYDGSDAAKGMAASGSALSKWESGLTSAAKYATVASAGVIAFGKAAFDSASKLQQSTGAVESVFGRQAAAVEKLAKGAAQSVGLAQSEYSQLAAVLGSQLKNMGVASKDLVPTTDKLISRGADLAAMFGGTTADAVAALSAALRGEMDPLEQYGISIKEADVQAELAKRGLDNLSGAAAKSARTQVLLSMIFKQSADAAGQFARESDTAAGQQQRAAAEYENAKAALGQALLPVVAQAAQYFASFAQVLAGNVTATSAVAVGILALTAALWTAVAAIKTYRAAVLVSEAITKAWNNSTLILALRLKAIAAAEKIAAAATKLWNSSLLVARVRLLALAAAEKIVAAATRAYAVAQRILNVAMRANVIGIIITALVGLAALFVLLWKRSETFRRIVTKAFQLVKAAASKVYGWMKSAWSNVFGFLKNPISRAMAVIVGLWGRLRSAVGRVLDWIKSHWRTLLVVLTGPFGAAVVAIVNNWDKIKAAASRVVAFIRRVWSAVVSWMASLIGRVADAASRVFGRIGDYAGRAADKIRSYLGRAVDWIRAKFGALGDIMARPFEVAYDAIDRMVDMVRDAISWVGDLIDKVSSIPSVGGIKDKITGLFSAPAPPAPTTLGATLRPARRVGAPSMAGGPGPTVINVHGALDPDAVARQIARLLTSSQRRRSGVVLTPRTF